MQISRAVLCLTLAAAFCLGASAWRGGALVAEAVLPPQPPTVTITAADKFRAYGANNPAFTVTYAGFNEGDDESALGGTLTCTTDADATSPIGNYTIECSGLTSDTYQIVYVTGNLVVNFAALTVTVENANRTYGADNPTFAGSITGIMNNDAITATYATTATAASAAGTYTISATLSDPGVKLGNYRVTNTPGTLTINKAPLTVTADDAVRVQGTANPGFTASYSGFVLGQGPSALGGTLSLTTNATAGSPAGTYAITPAGLTSDNYQITFVAGTLTVNPPPNRPPAATNDSAETPLGVPVTVHVLANDSDPDNDRLTVTQATSADGQATVHADGSITFSPSDKVRSSATVDYSISDGRGGTASARVFIRILWGRIEVAVQDVTGQPLSGIPVDLVDQAGRKIAAGTTGLSGNHAFPELPAGTMEVRASVRPSVILSAQATVVLGQTVQVLLVVDAPIRLAVSPAPRSILGNGTATSRITAVLTDAVGSPIAGRPVQFETSAGILLAASALTDAAGRAEVDLRSERLTNLTAKDAVIVARATDAAGRAAVAQTTVTFTPAAVTGVVTDRTTGRPVAGASVALSEDFDNDGIHDFAATTTTDPDGRYAIFVPRGNWTYTPIIQAPLAVGDRTITVRSVQKARVETVAEMGQNYDGEKMVSGQLFAKSPANGQLVTPAQLFGGGNVSGMLRSHSGDSTPRAFSVAADGTFAIEAVPIGQYTLLFRIELPNSDRLAGVAVPVTVEKNGEVNLTLGLVDPYGTVTDAVTGQVIVGAKMQLFWANTAVNRSYGRLPHTLVHLPELPDFPPNQNRVPQFTSATGEYAWMVWADGDYYIVAEAEGYETYDSRVEGRTVPVKPGEDSYITDGIIHVGEAIVEYHLQMRPLGTHGAYIKGYPDGTFRPEGLITRAEIAAIFARLSSPTRPSTLGPGFADVPDEHWASAYTRLVRQLGLMTGDSQGRFRPDAPITRGEMAQVVERFGRLTGDGPIPRDIGGHWAEQAIRRAIGSGVMIGYPDGTFRPDQYLTRAEAVATINRLTKRMPARVNPAQTWPDAHLNHWAFAEIEEASQGHRYARSNDESETWLFALDLETW